MNTTPTTDSVRIQFADRDLPETPAGILPSQVLAAIAADAGRRAATLLDGRAADYHDDVVDLIRLIQTTGCDASTAAAAAERAGLSNAALSRLRVAYTFAGLEGVHTAYRAYDPEPGAMNAAIATIRRHHNVPADALTVERNHLTALALEIQVRLSVTSTWFPYTASGQGWAPVRGESSNPADAFHAAVQARRARH
jgi:hypothetical protein